MWHQQTEKAIRTQISEDLRRFGLDDCLPIALPTRKLRYDTKEIRALPTAPLIDPHRTITCPTEVH